MSARNYMTNDQLVKDAVYNRRREQVCRDSAQWSNTASIWLRQANAHAMCALASENVLVDRIERILRRQSSPW